MEAHLSERESRLKLSGVYLVNLVVRRDPHKVQGYIEQRLDIGLGNLLYRPAGCYQRGKITIIRDISYTQREIIRYTPQRIITS